MNEQEELITEDFLGAPTDKAPKPRPPMMKTKAEFSEHVTYDPITGRFTSVKDGSNPVSRLGRISLCGRGYEARRIVYAMMMGETPDFTLANVNGDALDTRWNNIGKHRDVYCETFVVTGSAGEADESDEPNETDEAAEPETIDPPTVKVWFSPYTKKTILTAIIRAADLSLTDTNEFNSAKIKHSIMGQSCTSLNHIEKTFEELRSIGVLTYIGDGNFDVDVDLALEVIDREEPKPKPKPKPKKLSNLALRKEMVERPAYDVSTELSISEIDMPRIRLIGAGYLPCNGIKQPYSALKYEAITSLSVKEILEINDEMEDVLINGRPGAKHYEFLKLIKALLEIFSAEYRGEKV